MMTISEYIKFVKPSLHTVDTGVRVLRIPRSECPLHVKPPLHIPE